MKIIDETSLMARGIPKVRRITACEKDRKEVERREFEVKGMSLMKKLREEVEQLKKAR